VGPRAGLDTGEEKNSQQLSELQPLIIQSIAEHCTTEISRLLNKTDVLIAYFKEGV
jgi:hypothetical protein